MSLPQPSAVTRLVTDAGAKSSSEALPFEVLHNLQHQHGWTDLQLYRCDTSQGLVVVDLASMRRVLSQVPGSDTTILISGVPPRHMYIHPDLLNRLVHHGIKEDTLPIQREWVMPMSIGEQWSLKRLCGIFDSLPTRSVVHGGEDFQHQDSKRVFLGMLAHNGAGGDGTIVYYIMHEGEVKPRQN